MLGTVGQKRERTFVKMINEFCIFYQIPGNERGDLVAIFECDMLPRTLSKNEKQQTWENNEGNIAQPILISLSRVISDPYILLIQARQNL